MKISNMKLVLLMIGLISLKGLDVAEPILNQKLVNIKDDIF